MELKICEKDKNLETDQTKPVCGLTISVTQGWVLFCWKGKHLSLFKTENNT